MIVSTCEVMRLGLTSDAEGQHLRTPDQEPKGLVMEIGSIIAAIIIGTIIGLLGRLVAPGKQNISLIVTIIVGILAALLGTWIAGQIGVEETNGIDWIELLIQIVLAAIGVTIAANMLGRRRRV